MRVVVPRPTRPTRRTRIGAALVIPALLALAGWAAAGPVAAADDGSYVTVYQDSSGKTVSVPKDGILAVVLQANGGTGYEWRATQEPSTSVIATPADVSWPYTVTASDLLGAPVSWVWYFPALAPGTTAFAAGLYPPGVQTAEETFSLDIVVRDETGATATLTEPDCGQMVGIDGTGVVSLKLDSNASTGYSWKVTQEPGAILASEPGSGDYAAPAAGSPPGAGGSQTFAWRANAAGSTTLQVGYVPPGQTAPAKTCALAVVAGAPVLPPARETAAQPTPTDGTVASTPPPTSTDGSDTLPPSAAVGLGAFLVFLVLLAVTTPVLAVRRRRIH